MHVFLRTVFSCVLQDGTGPIAFPCMHAWPGAYPYGCAEITGPEDDCLHTMGCKEPLLADFDLFTRLTPSWIGVVVALLFWS